MSLAGVVLVAKIHFINTIGGLVPLTEDDRERKKRWKLGAVISADFKQVRDPVKHRKFFALLNLAYDYYEPTGGLLTSAEKNIANMIFKELDAQTQDRGVILDWGKMYLDKLQQSRRSKVEDIHKALEPFRKEMIIASGYYDLVETPTGVVKVARSMSFANMAETEFQEFYKAMFNTLWRFVLSTHFATEQEAEQAAMKMLEFAG